MDDFGMLSRGGWHFFVWVLGDGWRVRAKSKNYTVNY